MFVLLSRGHPPDATRLADIRFCAYFALIKAAAAHKASDGVAGARSVYNCFLHALLILAGAARSLQLSVIALRNESAAKIAEG